MYLIFFIHSSAHGHLGCFLALNIVKSAAKNIGVHVYFQIIVFYGYVPMSWIAGPYGNSDFPGGSDGNSPAIKVTQVPSLDWEDALEK